MPRRFGERAQRRAAGGGERRSPRSPQHPPAPAPRTQTKQKVVLPPSLRDHMEPRHDCVISPVPQGKQTERWKAAQAKGSGARQSRGPESRTLPQGRAMEVLRAPSSPLPALPGESDLGLAGCRVGWGLRTGWHGKAVNREERKGNSYGLHANGAQRRAQVPPTGGVGAALASPRHGGRQRWLAPVCVLQSLQKKAGKVWAPKNFPLQTATTQRTRVKIDSSAMLQLRPLLSGQYQTTAAIKIPRQIPR